VSDVEELSRAIELLKNDTTLRKNKGEAGKIRARQFDISKTAEILFSIYQKIYSRHKVIIAMGGWITIFGSISDFDGRLSRFRKMFSVEGMPSIRTEINEYSEDFRTVSWSWNCNEVPDVQCKKKGDNDVLVYAALLQIWVVLGFFHQVRI